MAINGEDEYQEDDDEITCFECSESLEPNEVFTCENCSTDFCKKHIKRHTC